MVIAVGVAASLLAGFNGTDGGQIAQAAVLVVVPVLVAWLARGGGVLDPAAG
jgi:hypothetical protein